MRACCIMGKASEGMPPVSYLWHLGLSLGKNAFLCS